ncbi:MAG: dephospho-CoA kinase [Oscillospiraceae bacterium]|jgi:dephospho-CoA kinase|nr:dephospho-CoA kinase [Oscillospiraceae bacterium]
MIYIGITGGTGAGKTTAVEALQTFGALALDCDEIYHELLISSDEMKAEIKSRFKDISSDGRIDRKKLGKIVWNDPISLSELNVITHKYVNMEIEQRINMFKSQGGNIVAIDAIALIESGQCEKCNVIVGINAPFETRLLRIMKRDNLIKELAELRISAQQPESFYIENCDYILENNYDTHVMFKEKCIEFFGELIKNAS